MTERIRFHFDVLCPWCYQTSRWIHRLVELGEVEADWGVFSLERVNNDTEQGLQPGEGRAERALRTVIAVREAEGPAAVARYYAAIGAAIHQRYQDPAEPAVVAAALEEAGLDPALADRAMADEATWDALTAEHDGLVARTRSFGVPTIVLDGGEGPAIFGPVISEVPGDDDAVELFRHVVWLTRYENFSELKRDRTIVPDLESVRRFMAQPPQE